MSTVSQKIWHCDICGFEWVKTEGIIPAQCPSRKCRSRRWNSGRVVGENEKNGKTSNQIGAGVGGIFSGIRGRVSVGSGNEGRNSKGRSEADFGSQHGVEPSASGDEAGIEALAVCAGCGALGGMHKEGCKG